MKTIRSPLLVLATVSLAACGGDAEGDSPLERVNTMREAVGTVYLADISVPPELYARMGLPAEPLFGAGDVLRV
jgi:hypothetical protein